MVEYRQVPYRWVNLTIYIFAALVNSLPVHTFSSINTSVQDAFDFSPATVTSFALIYTILHPIGAFPANWMLDKFGSQKGCILGSIFVIAGVWVRTILQKGQPQWCLIGSFLAAFGNLFVLNSAMKVAVNWFGLGNIPNVIFLAVLANQISMTLGAALPGLILQKNPSSDDIKTLVFWQAVVITIPLVLLIIFYRDKPQIPPSKAASKQHKKQNYGTLLKRLFSNKQYIKILIGMTLSYGTQIAFIATLDQLLNNLGYSDSNQTTAMTILLAMIVGILATPLFSSIIKKTKKYKLVTILNILGCYVFLGVIIYVFNNKWQNQALIAVCAGMAGFFLIPNVSLYLAYSAEVAFPIGQGSAGGYLFAGGQTFGFLLGIIIVSVVGKSKTNILPTQLAFVFYEILFLLSLLAIFLTTQDLRRQKYQQNRKSSIVASGGIDNTHLTNQGQGQGEGLMGENLEDSLIIHR